jgi:hypothetical protein
MFRWIWQFVNGFIKFRIINPTTMSKNVVIAMLASISICSLVFAFVELSAAERAKDEVKALKIIAEENAVLARQNAVEAMNQRKISEQQMLRAKEIAALAALKRK